MHGTSYLSLRENVVFEAMGHNFFIEDAAETKNYHKFYIFIFLCKKD